MIEALGHPGVMEPWWHPDAIGLQVQHSASCTREAHVSVHKQGGRIAGEVGKLRHEPWGKRRADADTLYDPSTSFYKPEVRGKACVR